MSLLTAMLLISVIGLATYGMRSIPILLLADRELPPIVAVALRNVAPAVLAALVVTLIASPDESNFGVSIPEIAGLVVGGAIAWKTRNLIFTLGTGMAVFWLLLWLA